MAHAVGGNVGKHAAVEIVDIQVMTGPFDFDRQTAVIGQAVYTTPSIVKVRSASKRLMFCVASSMRAARSSPAR